MRLHAVRLVKADGSYSDDRVGAAELRRTLDRTPSVLDDGQTLLDELGVRRIDRIGAELDALDAQLAEVAHTLQATGQHVPIEELRAAFGLSHLELDVLLVAAAPRLSIGLSRLYTVARPDYGARRPTAGFIAEVVAGEDRDLDTALATLAPARTLRRYRLVEPGQCPQWAPHTPLLHAPLAVPERLLELMRGRAARTTSLPGCRLHLVDTALALDDVVVAEDARRQLIALMREPLPTHGHRSLLLLGAPGSGRRTLAAALFAQLGLATLEVDLVRACGLDVASQDKLAMEMLVEVAREALLTGAVLVLRCDGLSRALGNQPGGQQDAVVVRLADALRQCSGTVVMTATEAERAVTTLAPEAVRVELGLVETEGQRTLWRRALEGHASPARADALADQLAAGYRMTPGAIRRAVEQAIVARARRERALPGRGRTRLELSTELVVEAVRDQIEHDLGWLADPVTTPLALDDLVLSDGLREQLLEVLRHARNAEVVFHQWGFVRRSPTGRGLSVMFSGPPGTGKSLAASVVARELGRVLYRVDLSRIVDKYIGETEKNLSRIFDEAERAQAVLLFDEADSLFARRTAVKSSNDRYANLEVNYLLQRLEAYDGVSVLTTNFATSIDEAFQRRIRFKITFPMPEPQQRADLWQRLVPPEAPLARDIDWLQLGEDFELTGGHIRNAVLRAAIAAADAGASINEAGLRRAAVAELREMGALVGASDARETLAGPGGGVYDDEDLQWT